MRKGIKEKFEHPILDEGNDLDGKGTHSFSNFLSLISRKYALDILHVIISDDGMSRFNRIALETGASPKTIANRLNELCSEGILERKAYAEIPPRVEYSLTDKGEDIAPIMGSIWKWCEKWG